LVAQQDLRLVGALMTDDVEATGLVFIFRNLYRPGRQVINEVL